jgi:Ca-activated chloride channel homolog
MPSLTLSLSPNPIAAGLLSEPQLCYALLTVGAAGDAGARAVNWALVADASRSMRIPIVDEAQFRKLIRDGGAQEVLVDGVPVWQLSGPVPPDVRAQRARPCRPRAA